MLWSNPPNNLHIPVFHYFCRKSNLTRNCDFVELRGNYNTVRKLWVRAFICYCSLPVALRNAGFRLNLFFRKSRKNNSNSNNFGVTSYALWWGDRGSLFIYMEYMVGGSLDKVRDGWADRRRRHRQDDGDGGGYTTIDPP